MKSYVSFRLLRKLLTLHDLERRNAVILRYFTEFGCFRDAMRIKVVEDVVAKKFTLAVSSPDEFHVK